MVKHPHQSISPLDTGRPCLKENRVSPRARSILPPQTAELTGDFVPQVPVYLSLTLTGCARRIKHQKSGVSFQARFPFFFSSRFFCFHFMFFPILFWVRVTRRETRAQLPPLDLLSRMAPLAFVQMTIFAFLSKEVTDLCDEWEKLSSGWALWIVAMTGVGSFSLNLCSLMANKVTSPLTLSIMANIKQVRWYMAGNSRFWNSAAYFLALRRF